MRATVPIVQLPVLGIPAGDLQDRALGGTTIGVLCYGRDPGHDHRRDGNVRNDDGIGWIVAMVAMMAGI